MEGSLRAVFREFCFPVGVLTTKVIKNEGVLTVGDLRGCTITSFRIVNDSICSFSLGKSRLMTSALGTDFAFHFLHQGQQRLASKFSVNNLSSVDQFANESFSSNGLFPEFHDFHSLITGKVMQRLEVGEAYFYIAEIKQATVNTNKILLHYTQAKFV